jgi:hypothetical protein
VCKMKNRKKEQSLELVRNNYLYLGFVSLQGDRKMNGLPSNLARTILRLPQWYLRAEAPIFRTIHATVC